STGTRKRLLGRPGRRRRRPERRPWRHLRPCRRRRPRRLPPPGRFRRQRRPRTPPPRPVRALTKGTPAMPSIQESAVAPSTGQDLTRLNAALAFLQQKLSAPDYQTAVNLLWAAIDPVRAAAQNAGRV